MYVLPHFSVTYLYVAPTGTILHVSKLINKEVIELSGDEDDHEDLCECLCVCVIHNFPLGNTYYNTNCVLVPVACSKTTTVLTAV